jgi:hypothetical protein
MKLQKSFYDPARDGITQGLLAMWMHCRQKARWFLQGYSPKYSSMGLVYGEIGHAVLEMVYSDVQTHRLKSFPSRAILKAYLATIEKKWLSEHPRADKKSLEHLELSFLIAEATLPIYFEYWVKDIKEMKWQALEHEFKILFFGTLLRGKVDGTFNNPKLWLFESKFKSRISEEDLVDTLPLNFQVNFYLLALYLSTKILPSGVLYNIIRRIGLEQRSKETITQFAARCIEDIRKRPEFYFIRMEVAITKEEILDFQKELGIMVAEFLAWWKGELGHYKSRDCIEVYGRCNYLNLCSGKGTSAYMKRNTVYRELEEI